MCSGRPKMCSGWAGIAQLQFAIEITYPPLQARNLIHQREQIAAGGHPPRVQPLLGHALACGGEPSLHPDGHGSKIHERLTLHPGLRGRGQRPLDRVELLPPKRRHCRHLPFQEVSGPAGLAGRCFAPSPFAFPPRVSLHLVSDVKVALCKEPIVVAAVLPAPAARAGPEGLHERPDLHNAPCPPRCRRTMFGRGSMLVAASLRGQLSFSPCLPLGRRWGIRMLTAPATRCSQVADTAAR